MNNHPELSALYALYLSESQPFRKVHRMIDLFESIIKSHTVVMLGEYVKHNKLSDAAKGMLAQGLRTPSLGTWQLFSRVLFEELLGDGYAWAFTNFPLEFAALDKALNADKTNVIAFRNGYAHGATPTDAQCEADIKKFDPFLKSLLQSQWITTTHVEPRVGKVWVMSDSDELCVHPLLLHKPEGGDTPYAFFNDLKSDKVGLLNYPLSKHYREKEFYKEFHECLPLHEWKKLGNNEFFQRIEELTETFKGRILERERMLRFVRENHKGYCSIQGNPGIGKSALIAQFFKDLRVQKELTDVQVVEYFIRRGTIQAQTEYVFNYLIRRTDELFAPGKEIRAEGNAVWDLQQQLFAKWRLWGELCSGKKLLFLMDGLDEGTENNVVTYLPRENFEGVLIIYGSRPGGHKTIDELWTQLPTEHHTKLELAGLGREDIRALIYEVANKYEVERESAWIDAVQQRSQGNPLYLKLLCNAIEHSSVALNDIQALPDKIDEYYKAILDRYAADTVDGDSLLACLFTFTAARDYLTMAHLGLINKLGDAIVQRIGSTLKEVLYENPLTEEVLDYQLFHESFREYLVKEKAQRVSEANERIIDFCSTWNDLEGSWEQRYALQHYAAHAFESKREMRATELLALMGDMAYADSQKKVLQQFDATNELYRLCLLRASDLKQYDQQLSAALSLVDLKYEEANGAPQVVALVASGDIDLALKRIESFGGADEEGVKRKFILYMLCLMELTLLDSRDKSFSKTSIEKLLHHLDENLPTDHSILKWNDFFPCYTVFLMACECAIMNLDYGILYKRTNYLEHDWITARGGFSDLQLKVLLECARFIVHELDRSCALRDITIELTNNGKVEDALSVTQEALECAKGLSDPTYKSKSLIGISTVLTKLHKFEESAYLIQEAIVCARSISGGYWRSNALLYISTELAKQGKLEESLSLILEANEITRFIVDKHSKCSALIAIAVKLNKHGNQKEAIFAMKEAREYANGFRESWEKNDLFMQISIGLAQQENLEEALECALSLSDESVKCNALLEISTALAKHGKLSKAIECARSISDANRKCEAIQKVSIELAKLDNIQESAYLMQEALACTDGINDVLSKFGAIKDISSQMAQKGNLAESASVMNKALETSVIWHDSSRNSALKEISNELAKLGKFKEALFCANDISDDFDRLLIKIEVLKNKASVLALDGLSDKTTSIMQEAIEYARDISDDNEKSSVLNEIFTTIAKQGNFKDAETVMQEALECARSIDYDFFRSKALIYISSELAKLGQLEYSALLLEEAFHCARGIDVDVLRDIALNFISTELAQQGKTREAYDCAASIIASHSKCNALKDIATELVKHGDFEVAENLLQEALDCAHDLSDRTGVLRRISYLLAKRMKVKEADSVMKKALECAYSIIDDNEKSSVIKEISSEFAKHGKWQFAESLGMEIPNIAQRQTCWKELAGVSKEQGDWSTSLQKVTELQNDEARMFYLRGWSEKLVPQEVNKTCLQQALPLLAGDTLSLENLLQTYAMSAVFFDNTSIEIIRRLNETLNIQWALDIASQLPKEVSNERMSTNLDVWLHEINDEDDQDQIELWAKQVEKGKITEADFGKKIIDF